MNETVNELRSTWTFLFPEVPPPDSRQWALWITLHGQAVVRRAIAKLAVRHQKSNDLQSADSLYKFASSLMSKLGMAEVAKP
jgi:hypothetical protein